MPWLTFKIQELINQLTVSTSVRLNPFRFRNCGSGDTSASGIIAPCFSDSDLFADILQMNRFNQKHSIDSLIMDVAQSDTRQRHVRDRHSGGPIWARKSRAVRLSLTLTDSWLWILRGIGSLITHNRNYSRTRQTHKALKQDERLPPLLPLAHISQIPLKLKEERGSWRHKLRDRVGDPYLVHCIRGRIAAH